MAFRNKIDRVLVACVAVCLVTVCRGGTKYDLGGGFTADANIMARRMAKSGALCLRVTPEPASLLLAAQLIEYFGDYGCLTDNANCQIKNFDSTGVPVNNVGITGEKHQTWQSLCGAEGIDGNVYISSKQKSSALFINVTGPVTGNPLYGPFPIKDKGFNWESHSLVSTWDNYAVTTERTVIFTGRPKSTTRTNWPSDKIDQQNYVKTAGGHAELLGKIWTCGHVFGDTQRGHIQGLNLGGNMQMSNCWLETAAINAAKSRLFEEHAATEVWNITMYNHKALSVGFLANGIPYAQRFMMTVQTDERTCFYTADQVHGTIKKNECRAGVKATWWTVCGQYVKTGIFSLFSWASPLMKWFNRSASTGISEFVLARIETLTWVFHMGGQLATDLLSYLTGKLDISQFTIFTTGGISTGSNFVNILSTKLPGQYTTGKMVLASAVADFRNGQDTMVVFVVDSDLCTASLTPAIMSATNGVFGRYKAIDSTSSPHAIEMATSRDPLLYLEPMNLEQLEGIIRLMETKGRDETVLIFATLVVQVGQCSAKKDECSAIMPYRDYIPQDYRNVGTLKISYVPIACAHRTLIDPMETKNQYGITPVVKADTEWHSIAAACYINAFYADSRDSVIAKGLLCPDSWHRNVFLTSLDQEHPLQYYVSVVERAQKGIDNAIAQESWAPLFEGMEIGMYYGLPVGMLFWALIILFRPHNNDASLQHFRKAMNSELRKRSRDGRRELALAKFLQYNSDRGCRKATISFDWYRQDGYNAIENPDDCGTGLGPRDVASKLLKYRGLVDYLPSSRLSSRTYFRMTSAAFEGLVGYYSSFVTPAGGDSTIRPMNIGLLFSIGKAVSNLVEEVLDLYVSEAIQEPCRARFLRPKLNQIYAVSLKISIEMLLRRDEVREFVGASGVQWDYPNTREPSDIPKLAEMIRLGSRMATPYDPQLGDFDCNSTSYYCAYVPDEDDEYPNVRRFSSSSLNSN